MSPPYLASFTRTWRFPLFLSLLLHGSILLPCVLFPTRDGWGGNGAAFTIDTRAAEPATEIRLILCEPRPAYPAPAEIKIAHPTVPPPATPSVVVEEKNAPSSLPRETVPAHETSEEQELAAGSPTTGNGLAGGPAGRGNNGATTTFFQIATEGRAIVYVIDRSASMGLNGCLAAAKRELLASLERLPSTARFQVIAYNRSAEPLRINGQSGLVFATPENKRYVGFLLEGIHAEGGTEHLPALKRALALGPDVIFFLTDADDLRGEQIRAITYLNHGRSVIHAIGLGCASHVQGDLPLPVLAQENRGVHKSVLLGP